MKTSITGGLAPSLHERVLVAAAQREDRAATEELFRRYEPLVLATVRRMFLPVGAHAEDIAQEARVGLLYAIRSWRPERGPFRAFAAVCVRHQATKAVDTAGAGKNRVLSSALSTAVVRLNRSRAADSYDTSCEWHNFDLRSRVAQPEDTVIAREQLAQLSAAMTRLTSKERSALVGDLNGRTHGELARAQGVSRKAVSLSVARARRRLARELDPIAA